MFSRAFRPLSRLSSSRVLLTCVATGVLAGGYLSSSSPSRPFAPVYLRTNVALCDAPKAAAAEGGGKEPATGIAFPHMVDGLIFVGAGVRVKYGFVKVRPGVSQISLRTCAAGPDGQPKAKENRRGETL